MTFLRTLYTKAQRDGALRSIGSIILAILAVTIGRNSIPNDVKLGIVISAAGVNIAHFSTVIPAKYAKPLEQVATDLEQANAVYQAVNTPTEPKPSTGRP
jgi:hypothetical protein